MALADNTRDLRTLALALGLALVPGLVLGGCGASSASVPPESPADDSQASVDPDREAEESASADVQATSDEASESLPSPRFDASEVPSRGPADAVVVVDIFSDFECPYCSLARRHTARLLEDFPSVRVRYRHFPLAGHPHSGMAAEASVEAYAQGGNDAFWCFHDLVFDNQTNLSRPLLLQLASRCDLHVGAMRAALNDHRHQARVEQDRAAGEALGLQGTPTFAVNGELVDGGDYNDVEEAVDHVHPSW